MKLSNQTDKRYRTRITSVTYRSMLYPRKNCLFFREYTYISREEKIALKELGADFAEHYVLRLSITFFGNE